MATNGSWPKNVPQDIQTALQKHDAVFRLSHIEIVSGINLLLRQGIPKEVISQVITQAVEAVSKEFNSLPYQDFYSRTETQPDAPNGIIVFREASQFLERFRIALKNSRKLWNRKCLGDAKKSFVEPPDGI